MSPSVVPTGHPPGTDATGDEVDEPPVAAVLAANHPWWTLATPTSNTPLGTHPLLVPSFSDDDRRLRLTGSGDRQVRRGVRRAPKGRRSPIEPRACSASRLQRGWGASLTSARHGSLLQAMRRSRRGESRAEASRDHHASRHGRLHDRHIDLRPAAHRLHRVGFAFFTPTVVVVVVVVIGGVQLVVEVVTLGRAVVDVVLVVVDVVVVVVGGVMCTTGRIVEAKR